MSLCVYTWVSLWGVCAYVCHFAHRHALMGLYASWTGTHSYSLQVGPPVLCPLSCLWLQLSPPPVTLRSLNAPPRLLLCRFLLWLPITYSVKAPCSLLASKAQSCSRLRLCFFLRRAFWTVGPWPSLRGQANTMARHQDLVAGSGTDSQGGESWGAKSPVMKAIPSLHLGRRNPPDLESLAQLLSPEPSLCSPVKIALCEV